MIDLIAHKYAEELKVKVGKIESRLELLEEKIDYVITMIQTLAVEVSQFHSFMDSLITRESINKSNTNEELMPLKNNRKRK